MIETRELTRGEFETMVVPLARSQALADWLGDELVIQGNGAVMVRTSEGHNVLAHAGDTLLRDAELGLVVMSPGAARILLAEPPSA